MKYKQHHMLQNKIKINNSQTGFTIVEMLVVVPIIILSIGIFVSAIVNMTGDVLENKALNNMSYDIQDALNRIQQDVNTSGGLLATNNITLVSPQGYDDDTTAFHNADENNGNMLILNVYASTDNSLDPSRGLIYIANQPSECNSENVKYNSPLMLNVVYFIKDNSLWRRVLAPSNYDMIGCNIPFQLPTCAPDIPDITGTICKAEDTKVIDDIESFTLAYYPDPNSSVANTVIVDPTNSDSIRQYALGTNNTVEVSISAKKMIAGREVSRSSSIRAVSANNNTYASVKTCPVGFILVPGSDTYETKDFCVMKYEAKADNDGDGIGDINQNTGYNTWPADSYPISASRKLVSTAVGYPVANISQTTSISAASSYTTGCASGCHLITEAEWMTIAQNVLSVAGNWSGGAVGSGYIYSGHNDNVPATAIEADANDANGYVNTGSASGNQKRTLILTNGEVIWDLAGNAWEWTQGTIAGGQQPGLSGESAYACKQWNNGSLLMNGLSALSQPSSTGIAGITGWNSTQGIGQLYSNYGEVAARAFLRGGCWNSGSDAGVLTLNLGGSSGDTSGRIGLRVSQ